MDFNSYLAGARTKIKKRLFSYCEQKKEEDLPQLFKEQKLVDSLSDFVSRGKLLRGSLFLFTVESVGGEITDEMLDIACAIELMHSALLIQDDVIDNDPVRRGEKTIYSKYEEEGKKIGAYDPYHYGVSTAIVTADVAFFFAMDLLSSYKGKYINALISYYSHEVYLVALSESADSLFGQTSREPELSEIYDVYKYKTARYTFSLPFEMGIIVVGGETKTRKLLNELGELVGIIFQLKDDELGIFGTEESIGKPIGSDIRENKKTVLRYMLYKEADVKDKQTLDSCFGNNIKAGHEETEKVKLLLKKYKVLEKTRQEADMIMEKVWVLFEKLELKTEYKKILKDLLEFNLQRSS